MSSVAFKPKAYLKEGCPFSFKFLLFAAESGIGERLEVIRCDPDAPEFPAIKSRLQAGLRKPATFPTVEVEPGRYMSDSDELIRYFAAVSGVRPATLPALSFYVETIFPQLLEHHRQQD
jgi:hypothetical protein